MGNCLKQSTDSNASQKNKDQQFQQKSQKYATNGNKSHQNSNHRPKDQNNTSQQPLRNQQQTNNQKPAQKQTTVQQKQHSQQNNQISRDQQHQNLQKKNQQQLQVNQHQNQQQQQQKQQQNQGKPLKSWDIRRNQQKNLDDYRSIKKQNETIIKLPGSLNGNQYQIDQCKNCIIYILDYTACITMDECEDCSVFIGPSESSVFVRSTKNSKLMICCGQFRSRDCFDLQIGLFCHSQPVIESSLNMQFFCFQYNYKGFKKQFDSAKLNVWKNNWSDIYDFTPKFGGEGLNYSYLPENIDPNIFMPLPDNTLAINYEDIYNNDENPDFLGDDDLMDSNEFDLQSCEDYNEMEFEDMNFKLIQKQDLDIPVSTGMRPKSDNCVLYFFKPEITEEVFQKKLESVAKRFNQYNKEEIYLRRATLIIVDDEQAQEVDLMDYAFKKMMFVFIGGKDAKIDQNFKTWLQEAGVNTNLILRQYYNADAEGLVKVIFENWNDERKK